MSKHFLALDIPDTYNPKIMVVRDLSEYSTELLVQNAILEIYSPGFTKPSLIDQSTTWFNNLSACSLGLQLTHCGEVQADLADGIYIIRYSVSPNDQVFVEYNHLRVTGIMNNYYVALGSVQLAPCEPDEDAMEKLEELELIKNMIDVAKIRVEDQNKPQQGIDLLMYANKRLDKFLAHCL